MKSFTSTLAVLAVVILAMSSLALGHWRGHGRGRRPPMQKNCYLESNGEIKQKDCRGGDICGDRIPIQFNGDQALASFCEGEQDVCVVPEDAPTEPPPLPYGACLVERLDGSPPDEYQCYQGDECTRCPKILCVDGVEAVVTFCGRPKADRGQGDAPRDQGDESDQPGNGLGDLDLATDQSGVSAPPPRPTSPPQRRGGRRGGRRRGRF